MNRKDRVCCSITHRKVVELSMQVAVDMMKDVDMDDIEDEVMEVDQFFVIAAMNKGI